MVKLQNINRLNSAASKILLVLFFTSVFLIGFNKIHDPDAWHHLSHGRLLWDGKGIPENESFTYPSAGLKHYYTSWAFGLIAYLTYLMSGAFGLVLLKAVIATAAFYVLYKDSNIAHKNVFVSVIILTIALHFSKTRFTLRPDLFLMLFLPLSIYLLNEYYYNNKKYIYYLPIVHLIWANMHSSIVLMFVPYGAFIAGGLLQRLLAKRGITEAPPDMQKIKTVSILMGVSFAATLINPNFINQYLYGTGMMQSKWYVQEIIELQPPATKAAVYLASFCITILLSFALNPKRISLINILLILPFMYLPFTAVRFNFILAVVAAPVVARNISMFAARKGILERLKGIVPASVSTAMLITYAVLVLWRVSPFGVWSFAFGFGFDESFMPNASLDYMDRNGIYGRTINSFHFGQYIIWRGYPNRTVFIDGRGYLSEGLLEKAMKYRFSRNILYELYIKYGFESILMRYENAKLEDSALTSGVDISFSNKDWALVFWDDKSQLYLRRGGPYQAIIDRDEYKVIKPETNYEYFVKNTVKTSNQMFKAGLEADLMRNIKETGSSRGRLLLGILYMSSGAYKDALMYLASVSHSEDNIVAFLANAYSGDAYVRIGNLSKALESFTEALKISSEPNIYYKVGNIYLAMNDNEKAASLIEKAIELDPNLIYAYPVLSSIYKSIGKLAESERILSKYQSLRGRDKGKQ